MNFLLALLPAPYQLIAKAIAVAALCAALLFAWHQFTGHYQALGFHQRDAEVAQLKLEREKFAEAAHECTQSIVNLKAASDKKKTAYGEALAEAQKRAQSLQQQSDWLLDQLNKPETVKKTCANALHEWRAQP